MIFFPVAIYFAAKRIWKMNFSKQVKLIGLVLVIASLPLALFTKPAFDAMNHFSKNKTAYFLSRSTGYFWQKLFSPAIDSNDDYAGFQNLFPNKVFKDKNYPLLHEFKNMNVLGSLFNKFDKAPNIVILIVEGLNDDFIHEYKGTHPMPFLSNLTAKSLYWNRCFTLGERSFAAVPSILGSLPYGEKGFTLLNELPRHLSLVSVLHANNYFTSFFYGQGAWFHQKDRFFGYNNIDLIVDNSKFSEKYDKIIVGKDNYFWGYNDKDLFNQSFDVMDTIRKRPLLNMYFTGTSHSPFFIPETDSYDQKFLKLCAEAKNDSDVVFLKRYEKYVQSILFVDDALELFFRKYESRPDYENTIFIITGDHPMTEIPIQNSLKRYHVPLIIYSEKLKINKIFTHTVSHLDVYETILSLLSEYNVRVPEMSTALGSNLVLDQSDNTKRIAFMNDNREVIDFYSAHYYLSGSQLFTVSDDLSLTLSDDLKVKEKLLHELKVFRNTTKKICFTDQLFPDSLYYKYLFFKMIQSGVNDSSVVTFNSEYFNILNVAVRANTPFYFDISFDPQVVADKNLCLVTQLDTKDDSLMYWQATNLEEGMSKIDLKLKFPGESNSDSIIYLKSYFWNRGLKEFKFKNMKYSIHQN
jgi:uncharacterized sulfatase